MTPPQIELDTPPSELEIADLLNLLKQAGHECDRHVNTIRRMAYERDDLKRRLKLRSLEHASTILHQNRDRVWINTKDRVLALRKAIYMVQDNQILLDTEELPPQQKEIE